MKGICIMDLSKLTNIEPVDQKIQFSAFGGQNISNIMVNNRVLSVVSVMYNWTTRTSTNPGTETLIVSGYYRDELEQHTRKEEPKLHIFMTDYMLNTLEELA